MLHRSDRETRSISGEELCAATSSGKPHPYWPGPSSRAGRLNPSRGVAARLLCSRRRHRSRAACASCRWSARTHPVPGVITVARWMKKNPPRRAGSGHAGSRHLRRLLEPVRQVLPNEDCCALVLISNSGPRSQRARQTSTCFSYALPSTLASTGPTAPIVASRSRTCAARAFGSRSSNCATSRGSTRGRRARPDLVRRETGPAQPCASQMSIPFANRPLSERSPEATGTLSSRPSRSSSGRYHWWCGSPLRCTQGITQRGRLQHGLVGAERICAHCWSQPESLSAVPLRGRRGGRPGVRGPRG